MPAYTEQLRLLAHDEHPFNNSIVTDIEEGPLGKPSTCRVDISYDPDTGASHLAINLTAKEKATNQPPDIHSISITINRFVHLHTMQALIVYTTGVAHAFEYADGLGNENATFSYVASGSAMESIPLLPTFPSTHFKYPDLGEQYLTELIGKLREVVDVGLNQFADEQDY